jgi:hypothetical protein
MSEMVRGGAIKPAGSAVPGANFGTASVGTATATLARPLAALRAALTHAWTCGLALVRQASRLPAPPAACMQACTIGRPTVIRQFSTAASCDSANADPVDQARKPSAINVGAEKFCKRACYPGHNARPPEKSS